MSYSVNLLTSIADCDSLLKKLEKEKDDLEFRMIQVTRLRKAYAANSEELTADLQAVDGEITTFTNMLLTLAEGKRKEDTITDLDRAKLRKRVLSEKQKDYGTVALIERELELAMATAQLAQVNIAIGEVNTRRGEIK